MKYFEIYQNLKRLVVFGIQDILTVDPSFRQNTLYDWQEEGKVIKLRKNRYVFADYQPENLDYYFLSNKIYEPSYVSLELALNHYGIIPEITGLVTAVSTRRTQEFTNQFGTFNYRSLAKNLFFGYKIIRSGNLYISIATIEKTVLDYLYLTSRINSNTDFEELRWNQQVLNEQIDNSLLEKYLLAFDNNSLAERVSIFNQFRQKS